MTPIKTYDAVDLYAGPGGWSTAAKNLGLNTIGIEWDNAACETRRAYGHTTIEGDVRAYDPKDFPAHGFIASAPCQTFSMAGKGSGRKALDDVCAGVAALAAREVHDSSVFTDERTGLILEPLRWILEAKDFGDPYEWIALEQVPTVLPVWEAYASVLRSEGYSVAVGKLQSEQFGVPQTRRRAVLVARLHGTAMLPAPTHRPYVKGQSRLVGHPDLLPWVSMANALGDAVAGSIQRSNYSAGGPASTAAERGRTMRSVDLPSVTVTSKAHSWVKGEESRRMTVDEAGQLQSFPSGYPWFGPRVKQMEQAGNAVPPLMAEAILRAVALPEGEPDVAWVVEDVGPAWMAAARERGRVLIAANLAKR